jgi:hypothetical protein
VQVRQFEGLLSPLLAPPLQSLPNAVMAWAALAIEELARLGVNTFAVAPGGISSNGMACCVARLKSWRGWAGRIQITNKGMACCVARMLSSWSH